MALSRHFSGGFRQVLLAGLYMSLYGKTFSEMARRVLKYGTLSRYFTLLELKFIVFSTTELRVYEVVTKRLRLTFYSST